MSASTPQGVGGRLWRGLLGLAALGLALAFGASLLGGVWFALDLLAHFRLQIGLAAAALALAALLTRARRIAALAGLLALATAVSLGPAWESPLRAAQPGCEAAPLRVAVANLLYHNHEAEAVAETLLALDADVLATLETTPHFSNPARPAAARLHAAYPHVSLSQGRDRRVFYAMIWSRHPILLARDGGGGASAPDFARADIALEGRRVSLLALHSSWPLVGSQERQFAGLAGLMKDAAQNRIVMGDFNAAPWSEALRRAAEATGATPIGGLRLTWRGRIPPGLPMPPGLPIDHILASPGIGVTGIEKVRVPASDHRAVVADLLVPICA